jgi:hypothetical protein
MIFQCAVTFDFILLDEKKPFLFLVIELSH